MDEENSVFLSTVEAEYIAVASCYAQLLCMKKLLHDYRITRGIMCVFCDNTSAINLSKNPVQYSKSKHIEIYTCEFRLVPLYLWHSAFTSLAYFVCTLIFVGEILKFLCDCCK